MVYIVNSHTNATRIGWHLWEIDQELPLGYLQGDSPSHSVRILVRGFFLVRCLASCVRYLPSTEATDETVKIARARRT